MSIRKTVLMMILPLLAAFTANAARPLADTLLDESAVSGGVVAHIGCGQGTVTADLWQRSDRLLVVGLDTDAGNVAKAKAYIDSRGRYGAVCAETYDGKNLPFGDNVVNLVVVEDAAKLTAKEIARALAPNGVAMTRGDMPSLKKAGLKQTGKIDGWVEYTKPWPDAIDEWTHYLYDASGNAVSKDRDVGDPRHLQWFAGPVHARHHDALASMSAMTTSDGRVFYIHDEGSVSLMHRPSNWKLIARDAFNGKLLWKRDIPNWMTQLYNFRAGPQQLPRRLVSVGDKVYVTLGWNAPVTELDAATGKTLRTFKGTEKTEEIILHDGMLLIVKGEPDFMIEMSDQAHGYWDNAEMMAPTIDKAIVAFDAKSGKELWTIDGKNLMHLVPVSLSAAGDKVFYLDDKLLRCVDAKNGKERWASSFETEGLFIRAYSPTVTIHQDVIMCLTWNRLFGYSIEDGKKLWENKGSMGFGSPGDLLCIDGKVWTNPMLKSIWNGSKRNKDGIITTGIPLPKEDFVNNGETGVGIDIHTGEITDLLPFERNQHHHRCYRDKATEQFILMGHSGIQLLDPVTKAGETNQWIRGICQYGIMPANGYIYVPTDPCQCYNNAKFNGYVAVGQSNSLDEIEQTPVLEKGSAYKKAATLAKGADPQAGWATYRGNIARSGATKDELPAKLSPKWEVEISESITPPVIAGDSVYIAERLGYAIHCLDRKDGSPKWKFLANGPIDSPPTIHNGLCLVGCGDGSVYCLDAKDGSLAWRFKASSLERRIGSEDRLESPLSISGSVLVLDDVVYFAAGRSSHLDGGIRVFGLDVATGKQRYSRTIASGYWEEASSKAIPEVASGKKPKRRVEGALADILISDGNAITMRQVRLSKELTDGGGAPKTIFANPGLLDDTWFDRQNWRIGNVSGQIVVYDETASFGVVNPYNGLKQQRKGRYVEYGQEGHHHIKFTRYKEEHFVIGSTIVAKGAAGLRGAPKNTWSINQKFQPRAMVLAGSRLYLAGWLDAMAVELKTGRPRKGFEHDPHESVLRVYAREDGKRLAEYKIESDPVFDGVATAYGDLFISLKNGKLVCMGGGK